MADAKFLGSNGCKEESHSQRDAWPQRHAVLARMSAEQDAELAPPLGSLGTLSWATNIFRPQVLLRPSCGSLLSCRVMSRAPRCPAQPPPGVIRCLCKHEARDLQLRCLPGESITHSSQIECKLGSVGDSVPQVRCCNDVCKY